tara:strand:+ start:36133 stop:36714 length:582 start_codon:yes stop_codon:yes gene_type:complete
MKKNYEIIKKGIGEIEFIFYPKKQWFSIIFIHIWLIGWLFGEVTVINILFFEGSMFNSDTSEGGSYIFLFIWLTFWTYGGFQTIMTLIWMMFGEELVKIKRQDITITRVLAFVRKKKTFELENVKNLIIQIEKGDMFSKKKKVKTAFKNYGSIRFDYKGREKRFGVDLDYNASQEVYNEIKDISRFTNLNLKD